MSSVECNVDFYQNIIQNFEKDNSIVVTKIEENICKKGYMSVVSRVNVIGYKESTPKRKSYRLSLVVKNLPSNEIQEKFRSNIAMKNENISYNTIIPNLKRHSAVNLPFGECYHAEEGVVILQDLCEDGYKSVGKSNGGLTIQQCERVIEGLAKLHAASFVFKHEEPEKFLKVAKMTKELLYEGGDSDLLKLETFLIRNLIDKFNSDCSKEKKKVVDVLKGMEENLTSKIKELLQNPGEYSVICHGDCWAENIMFNEKNELKLVDLQLMRYNSVASDLSYLLYVNLSPDDRAVHMEGLLNRYLMSLQANIKKKNVNMDNVLTPAWLDGEMKSFKLFGIFYGMWTTPVFFSNDEDVKEIPDSSKIGNLENPECAERIKKIILEYVKSLS